MRTSLSIALALLCVTTVAAAQDFDSEGEAAMLARVNALRAESHLAPLTRVGELDAVARAHSTEMASQGQLAHVSAATGTPEDRVRRAGIAAQSIAENVALHQDSARALEALLASPSHRANILSADVSQIGLGAVRTP
ncbi:MAG: CAP domain-containing protein, partial [Sandaracinaceae bacterium]|nr:CAP domain-containing protein [Sandaracinaceae bacterium]